MCEEGESCSGNQVIVCVSFSFLIAANVIRMESELLT